MIHLGAGYSMSKRKPDQVIRHEFALSRPTQDLLDTYVTSYSVANISSGLADLLKSPLGIGLSLLSLVRLVFPDYFRSSSIDPTQDGEEIDLSTFDSRKDLEDFLETQNLAAIATVGLGIWKLSPQGRFWKGAALIGGLVGGSALAEEAEDFIAAKQAARAQSILLWTLETQNRASQYQATNSFQSPAGAYM